MTYLENLDKLNVKLTVTILITTENTFPYIP